MLDAVAALRGLIQGDEPPEPRSLAPLRFIAAELLAVGGVDAALSALNNSPRTGDYLQPRRAVPPGSLAMRWVPVLLAPLAAAAHVRHGSDPSPGTAAATRILDAAVLGAGVAGLTFEILSRRRYTADGLPSLGPLALASAGLLGLLIDREERDLEEERDRLERKAAIVERFVPRRKARLDRVVVHV